MYKVAYYIAPAYGCGSEIQKECNKIQCDTFKKKKDPYVSSFSTLIKYMPTDCKVLKMTRNFLNVDGVSFYNLHI